jgi:hypothetical protein
LSTPLLHGCPGCDRQPNLSPLLLTLLHLYSLGFLVWEHLKWLYTEEISKGRKKMKRIRKGEKENKYHPSFKFIIIVIYLMFSFLL